MNRRTLLLGLAAIAMMAPIPAHARRRRVHIGGTGLRGAGSYGPGVLTRPQLEQCVRLERAINGRSDWIDQTEAEIEPMNASLQLNQQQLDRQAASVNRFSQASVDSYNLAIQKHRVAVAQFNRLVDDFNRQVAEINRMSDDFNKACANMRYYDSDMSAVLASLGSG